MDFKEFIRRMIEKLERGGYVVNQDENNEEYLAFMDRAAEIYLGVMIYSEFVNEQAIERMKLEKQAIKNRTKQNNEPTN